MRSMKRLTARGQESAVLHGEGQRFSKAHPPHPIHKMST
ncbi:hypothetical protein JMA_08530 [Jeotgalibacillus malaysiensis]|uniref:Uncharacterized protein n=1 Tax=Jeotgalibacillus malaysiensis TaxID=1508404 RepID=A0A0B5AIF6_9BACL|nr:hypothetical protein JMA_08530 [Jeotgalibacillus malaysiensis]